MTALVGLTPANFLEVREPGSAGSVSSSTVSSSPTELTAAGWRGVTVTELDAATIAAALARLGEPVQLHLLVAARPALLANALALLAVQSVSPWVIATGPDDTASGATDGYAGYRHVLFDGAHDYYLANAHLDLAVNVPAALQAGHDAQASVRRWRATALEGWQARGALADALNAEQELSDMKQTLSWRVTTPLRAVRRRIPTGPKR